MNPKDAPTNQSTAITLLIIFLRSLEIIGWITIHLPLFFIRVFRKSALTVVDAFFFTVYLMTKLCQQIGRLVLYLPFILVVFCIRAVRFLATIPGLLLSHLRPITSALLGMPHSGIWDLPKTRSPSATEKKRWPAHSLTARFEVFRISLLPETLGQAFVSEVDQYKSFRQLHTAGFAVSAGILLTIPIVILTSYYTILKDMPFPAKLRTQRVAQTTRIFDRNGVLLYKIYRSANRTPLQLVNIPLQMRQATIAIEDKDFYKHPGVSLRGIIRAAVANFSTKEIRFTQGGSTITQQLIKNTLLTPEKTITRKVKEIFLSLVAEAIFSKDEILEMYLNTVSYGGTAYGIEEAAQTYFKKSARDLTLPESALLAGLPSAPTTFSPHGAHPELSRLRQKEVLRHMAEQGYISSPEQEQAANQYLEIAAATVPIRAPHFVMYVKEYLSERLGAQTVEEGGYNVYTTLDWDIQQKAEEIVARENQELRTRYGANNAAAMVTRPRTGEILAMVGSANYWDAGIKGQVNVATSLRQPGSSIKVVNYAYALAHGGFTPSSVVLDAPVVYNVAGSIPYAPVNYDGRYHGMVTIRKALANSYNIPAVKILATYGPSKMVEMGKRMGITTWDSLKHYGLALTLGSAEVKMADMTVVYGTLANMGVRHDLSPIKEITDAYGKPVTIELKTLSPAGVVAGAQAEDIRVPTPTDGESVLSPSVAYWLTDILSDNKARLAAFGPYAKLEVPGHRVAVKTGTSNDFKDNWTIGYTSEYLVATWVGNTDSKPMNKNLVSGITGAAPIWNAVMTNLLKDKPADDFDQPVGLKPVKICASTGTLACANCKDVVTEYFIPGTEPKQVCNIVSPDECARKKAEAEAAGKKSEEIMAILGGCSLPTPPPNR